MERMTNKTCLDIPAVLENLDRVVDFIAGFLLQNGFDQKSIAQMSIAVEEIFTNICRYAYVPESGAARIEALMEPPERAVVRFSDSGRPFDPLAAPPPDTALPAEQRKQGGLGIFMMRQLVSQVCYQYKDGKNILTITKQKQTEAGQHGNQTE